MAVKIDYNKCINCKICYERCPEGLFGLNEQGQVIVKYPTECWLCGACQMDCPKDAVKVIYEANAKPFFLKRDDKE